MAKFPLRAANLVRGGLQVVAQDVVLEEQRDAPAEVVQPHHRAVRDRADAHARVLHLHTPAVAPRAFS